MNFCRENNLPYIPVAEELHGGTDYFTDICHMTLTGTQAKADVVFRHVKDVVQTWLASHGGASRSESGGDSAK